MSSLVDRLVPGARLGRYECLFPLARGGMAAVWVARVVGARGFQKAVAIKTMLPAYFDDPKYQAMFLEEARLASRLHHPNVVEVLELGEEGDALFMAMELVDGLSLNQVMHAGRGLPLPVDVVLSIGLDVCEGLRSAHEAKDDEGRPAPIVHRDVSPHNVMLSIDGVAKIGDFGIAKIVGAQGRTDTGLVKGKPAYMAPEQARGRPVDVRADVFSVGVMLYELSTGQHPYRGDTAVETAHRLMSGGFAPPRLRVGPSYPELLDAIVMRALAPEPNARFADTRTLGRALLDVAGATDARGLHPAVAALVTERAGALLEERRRRLHDALNRRPGEATSQEAAPSDGTATAPAAPGTPSKGRRGLALGAAAGVAALGSILAFAFRSPPPAAPPPRDVPPSVALPPKELPPPAEPVVVEPTVAPAPAAAPVERRRKRVKPARKSQAPDAPALPPIRDPGF